MRRSYQPKTKRPKEQNEIAKKQFETTKALSIAEASMAGAKAIVDIIAWGATPPTGPWKWAAAAIQGGIIGASTGIQIAAISSQEFIPAYAEGTANHPGGMALVGERGAEIVHLPMGSAVTPNHELTPFMSSGGNTTEINVYLDGTFNGYDEEGLVDMIDTQINASLEAHL